MIEMVLVKSDPYDTSDPSGPRPNDQKIHHILVLFPEYSTHYSY